MTIHASDLIDAMERIAPTRDAAEWDNVGLLVGAPEWPARRIGLTIDLTPSVLVELQAARTQAIVAYHPPLFSPLRRLTPDTATSRVVLDAARSGIAIYSPHTALDSAPNGLNDWLASGFGQGDVRALEPSRHMPATEACKVVTFCPYDEVERMRNALASIGAGRIGDYELCSFEIEGTGTFRGGAETQPVVGHKDVLERVAEVRLEMVCPRASLALAVTMVRQFHPYEEPPIEIYALEPRPRRAVGAGRRVVLDRPVTLRTIVSRIKTCLGVSRLRVAPGVDAPSRISTVGLCAGAGGSLVDAAIEQGCELYLTGEMRHHDVLAAQSRGCTVVLAGHTNTERGYLPILASRLTEALPKMEIVVSAVDHDPLIAM